MDAVLQKVSKEDKAKEVKELNIYLSTCKRCYNLRRLRRGVVFFIKNKKNQINVIYDF